MNANERKYTQIHANFKKYKMFLFAFIRVYLRKISCLAFIKRKN